MVDIETLIREVRKRPPLYDTCNKEYHDRKIKKQLWAEVCCGLITTKTWDSMNAKEKTKYEQEVQTKWNSLRTCFRREIKLNQVQNDGTQEKKKRKYIYYDDLLFLLPFIKLNNNESLLENDHASYNSDFSEEDTSEPKQPIPNAGKIKDSYEEPMVPLASLIKTEAMIEFECPEQTEYTDGENSVNPITTDYRHSSMERKRPYYEDDDHRPAKGSRRMNETKRILKLRDLDEDESFFASLLPSMKEFTSEEKLRLRIELITTILNFKNSINVELGTQSN